MRLLFRNTRSKVQIHLHVEKLYFLLVLRDKNAYDRQHLEKNLKEAKPFNFETDRRNIARSHDEQLIGKLYVELENRRVRKFFILSVKLMDD